MICEKFNELTTVEKVVFIGKITHACMSNDELFELATKLIKLAESKGVFDGVTILPKSDTVIPVE